MGHMHLQRALEIGERPREIVATNLHMPRIMAVEEKFAAPSAAAGVELVCHSQESFADVQSMTDHLQQATDGSGFDDIVVNAPSVPPLETELLCPNCDSPLNLRNGARGPWLGCSRFPKCRGRGKWAGLEEDIKADLEAKLVAHEQVHPVMTITRMDGTALTDAKGKPIAEAPKVDELVLLEDPRAVVAN